MALRSGSKAVVSSLFAACFTAQWAMSSNARAQSVSIHDGHLARDLHPWTPHGVVQIAFVAAPAAQKGVFAEAYEHYAPADYEQMRSKGIDSVRIQVSQPGLDPQGALFDQQFRDRVIGAVHAARAAGLVVLVSVQDEEQSGEQQGVAQLPNASTGRVWASLAPVFSKDTGVLYELLNEPNLPPTPANWRLWADAMNKMIEIVRASGAHNVVVADGLLFAERLSGAPNLRDRLQQVAYASHPYAHHAQDQSESAWANKFGDFARNHVVIVTEWATVPKYFCDANTPRSTEEFLRYLDQRDIGLMAYGWDFSGSKFGSTFYGFPPQLTAFQGLRCGDSGFGPGRAVERWYMRGSTNTPSPRLGACEGAAIARAGGAAIRAATQPHPSTASAIMLSVK